MSLKPYGRTMGAAMPKDENIILFSPARAVGSQAPETFNTGDLKEGLRVLTALMRVKDPEARLLLIELMEKFAENEAQSSSEEDNVD